MKDEPELTLHASEAERYVPASWRHPALWMVAIVLIVIIAAVAMQ
jgi:hypothetical protein